MSRQQLAAVHSRLNGTQASQDAHLFDITHDRNYIESLEFRVDRMQAAH